MAWRFFACIVMTATIAGCSAPSFDGAIPCEAPDAGDGGDGGVDLGEGIVGDGTDGIADAGLCIDGVPIAEFINSADGGSPTSDGDFCQSLVAATCGLSRECERDPGCVAADLLAKHEPERCFEVGGDARSFPPCALGTCAVLATKVCGGDAPATCEAAPACPPVRELAKRADAGDVSADDACAQALADETLFPACF